MKKTLLLLVLMITAPGLVMAADDMPQTLFQSSGMNNVKANKKSTEKASKFITQSPAAAPAPVATPAPVVVASSPVADCPAPAPVDACNVCSTPAPVPSCTLTPTCSGSVSYKVKEVPVRMVVEEMKVVPVKRRVVEEETYVVQEKRSASYPEARTRTKKRTIEVPDTKMVTEVMITEVKPDYGKSIRLARTVDRNVKVYNRKEVEQYEESYITNVKYNYTVPVAKTRKVTKSVEELKLVPFRKVVRGTEMRLVEQR